MDRGYNRVHTQLTEQARRRIQGDSRGDYTEQPNGA